MLIDWFTVGAQVINFVILVWLLKHFLYKPILTAIDAREKRIADELASANAKKAEAEKEQADFQAKNKAFDEQRAALLTKATDDAKAERERLLGEARKDADAQRANQESALQNDQRRLGTEITRMASVQVLEVARKALSDLATASLEERVVEVFTRRLREMDATAKEALGAALKASAEPAIVRSVFDLPAGQKAAIQNALNETFAAEIRLRFETAPDAICGIELTAGGQKLAWSVADYLKSLGQRVDALLFAPPAPAKAVASKPLPVTTTPLPVAAAAAQ
jgi:F-type H+-transporting ATPase subunit b